MFRGVNREHPRMGKAAKELLTVDVKDLPRQSFSESSLKEHGAIYSVKGETSPFTGSDAPLWKQYQDFCDAYKQFPASVSPEAQAIASRLHQIDLKQFKTPTNIHYASHTPERKFSDLLFDRSDLFDAFVKMPNSGGYGLPYSYKPAKAAKTHVANETFNPDFFIKVADKKDVLVVEVKQDGDDSNRNRAKCRDALRHFKTLNEKLEEAEEPWRYYFFFLSPDDYTRFFETVKEGKYKDKGGWRSSLMTELLS
jgi:type III restriction enzyme